MQVYRTMHSWHWISAAICLIGMLLFAITGITLNHASRIESKPRISTVEATLPPDLLARIKTRPPAGKGTLPQELTSWVSRQMGVQAVGEAEWSAQEIYLALPRPGGDAWLSVDLASGEARYERTDRGWISYLKTCTRAATRERSGRCSWMRSRSHAWCSASRVWCCCNSCRTDGLPLGRWLAWGS